MRVSKYSRKFHDPWGNKHGNRRAHIIGFQFQVGKSSLSDEVAQGEVNVHRCVFFLDKTAVFESTSSQFVRGGKNGNERLKR